MSEKKKEKEHEILREKIEKNSDKFEFQYKTAHFSNPESEQLYKDDKSIYNALKSLKLRTKANSALDFF